MEGRGQHVQVVVTLATILVVGTALDRRSPVRAQDQLFDAGQERQAIFPVYDGFTRNDDGSLTLSFAYFSHNSEPVEIPPGDDNFFSPGRIDLGQPTRFLPGHHRWQCVLVVDGSFAGDLRWTVRHAGQTTSTSDAMLQYNWEFSHRDLALLDLRTIADPTTQPRDVCLNRPPIVRVLGYGGQRRSGARGPPQSSADLPGGENLSLDELRVAVGTPLKLFGSVRDEGLPRSGMLTGSWQKLTGPGEVRFDARDQPRTLAYFSQAGDYTLALTGSDSSLEQTVEVTVVVTAP